MFPWAGDERDQVQRVCTSRGDAHLLMTKRRRVYVKTKYRRIWFLSVDSLVKIDLVYFQGMSYSSTTDVHVVRAAIFRRCQGLHSQSRDQQSIYIATIFERGKVRRPIQFIIYL